MDLHVYTGLDDADATLQAWDRHWIGLASSVDGGEIWWDHGPMLGGWSPSALVVGNEVWVPVLFFRTTDLTAGERAGIDELSRLLGLVPDIHEFELTSGPTPASGREIALQTRSLTQILVEVGGQVSVPASHLGEGRATPVGPLRRKGPRAASPSQASRVELLPAHCVVSSNVATAQGCFSRACSSPGKATDPNSAGFTAPSASLRIRGGTASRASASIRC